MCLRINTCQNAVSKFSVKGAHESVQSLMGRQLIADKPTPLDDRWMVMQRYKSMKGRGNHQIVRSFVDTKLLPSLRYCEIAHRCTQCVHRVIILLLRVELSEWIGVWRHVRNLSCYNEYRDGCLNWLREDNTGSELCFGLRSLSGIFLLLQGCPRLFALCVNLLLHRKPCYQCCDDSHRAGDNTTSKSDPVRRLYGFAARYCEWYHHDDACSQCKGKRDYPKRTEANKRLLFHKLKMALQTPCVERDISS